MIEAQALGLPVVSTRCPTGPDEIVEDGVTGTLVPPGDVQAVADALRSMLSNEERRAAMGRQGQHRMRRLFHVRKITLEWDRLLNQVVEDTPQCAE